jgi:hypothetical protein
LAPNLDPARRLRERIIELARRYDILALNRLSIALSPEQQKSVGERR